MPEASTATPAHAWSRQTFATGMRTEFGKIAHLTQTAAKSTSHLQREIARLSRLVAIFATVLGLAFFAIGTAIGLPFWTNLIGLVAGLGNALVNLYLKYYSLIINGAVLLLISNNYSNLLDAIRQIEPMESDQLTDYGISPKKLADSLHQLSPGLV